MFFSPALRLSLPDIHRLTHTNTYAHAHINRSQITRHKKYKKVYVFNTQQQQQQHEPKSFMLIFFLSSVVENFIMFFGLRGVDFKMKLSVLLETFPHTVDWANRHQPTHNKT